MDSDSVSVQGDAGANVASNVRTETEKTTTTGADSSSGNVAMEITPSIPTPGMTSQEQDEDITKKPETIDASNDSTADGNQENAVEGEGDNAQADVAIKSDSKQDSEGNSNVGAAKPDEHIHAEQKADNPPVPSTQAERNAQSSPGVSSSEENICSRNTKKTKRASLATRDINVDADSIIAPDADKEELVRVQRTLYYIQHVKHCTVPGGCGNNCRTMQEANDHLQQCVEEVNGTCDLPHCLPTRLIVRHWNTCDRGDRCHICQPVRDEMVRVGKEEAQEQRQGVEQEHGVEQEQREQREQSKPGNAGSAQKSQQSQTTDTQRRPLATTHSTDDSDVVDTALHAVDNGVPVILEEVHEDGEELHTPICRCGHHTEPRDPVTAPIVDGVVNGTVSEISQLYFSDEPQNDVWDMFMKQEPSMQPYIDSYKNTPWKLSKKECCLERFFTFLSPPAALPSIMSSTHVPITQVHRKSQPDPDQLVYKTRAISHNVPYATVFAVDTSWYFVQKEKNSVQMKVYVDVIFLQSCWVKAILRGATRPSAVDGAAAVAKMVVVLSHKVSQQQAHNLETSQSFPGSPMAADFRALVGSTSARITTPIPEDREAEESETDDGIAYSTATQPAVQSPKKPVDKAAKTPMDRRTQSPRTLRPGGSGIGRRAVSLDGDANKEPIISVGAPLSTPLAEMDRLKAANDDHEETAHASDSDLPPTELSEKRFPSTRPEMLRRHSTTFASRIMPQPHRSMSVRTRLRLEPNLVHLFDDMKESEYQDIFGADAEMRVVQAANFNSEHPLGLEDSEVLDDLELMALRVHDLPLQVMLPMVISIPLGLTAIYLWSRLGDCLHANRRLGEEWDVLWHITEALSKDSNNSEVHRAYERFATMGAAEFSTILAEQTKAAYEAQQLLATYSQLVNEFKGEYIEEGVSWGWISASITFGTVTLLLVVGCALSVRLLKALTNPDS